VTRGGAPQNHWCTVAGSASRSAVKTPHTGTVTPRPLRALVTNGPNARDVRCCHARPNTPDTRRVNPARGTPAWPTQVRRRDGTLVTFDVTRIEAAVALAAREARTRGSQPGRHHRYGSRIGQVLTFGTPEPATPTADTFFGGGCAAHTCEY
jgi:hypothetical protein